MSGDTWVRIDIFKPRTAHDQQALTQFKKTLNGFLTNLEKSKQPGFQIGYRGRNDEEGTMSSVTYWSDRRSADAAAAGPLRQLMSDAEAAGLEAVDSRNVHLFSLTKQQASQGVPDAPPGVRRGGG